MTVEIPARHEDDKTRLTQEVVTQLESVGYTVEEVNTDKPWGAYIRLASEDADQFIGEYFDDISPEEARLGVEGLELSPKILIAAPRQRLSWQYHYRRAERWKYLTPGGFNLSETDDEGQLQEVDPGYTLQIKCGERHRLVASDEDYTLVAEIWQHVDKDHPSDEDDIVRLQDDYAR